MKISKKQLAATLMTTILAGSVMVGSVVTAGANNVSGSPEEQADITNWIANTPEQISNNMAMQHINTNNLNGTRYIIQWGDTLSGISAATGISVAKLCYDNNIQNANLIFAGDVLILDRTGSVPAGYNPNVDPYAVAQTKVTINNGPTTVNIAVQPQSIVKNYDQTDNSDHSTTIYKAGATNNNNNENESSQSSTTKSTKKHHSSSVSAADIVSGLNDANENSKLSFDEGNGGSDADELDVNSAAILKNAKKDNYDAILSEIESALGSKAKKDITIYIEKDGNEIHVYASVSDDDSSSNSSSTKDSSSEDSSSTDSDSDSDSSQSSSDEDSNSQATISDQDTDTSDDE